MTVRLATEAEYYQMFTRCATVFSSQAFIHANACRAQAVRWFVGYDEESRPRLGIVLGLRDGSWHAPFSSPFAELQAVGSPSLEQIYDFTSELADTLAGQQISITLPPPFYDPAMLSRATGVLANYASQAYYDYNYHYDLARAPHFAEYLDRAARKNYRRACESGFLFAETDDIERAYAVIRANRESRGYPLAMSLQQVADTVSGPAAPVHARFYLLTRGSADVAAAMVYDVADGIAQVVYWGDAPGHSQYRPMNLLPVRLFQTYRDMGYRVLDIGPSSKHGIPSSGLCRFKESLGCTLTLKPTVIINT